MIRDAKEARELITDARDQKEPCYENSPDENAAIGYLCALQGSEVKALLDSIEHMKRHVQIIGGHEFGKHTTIYKLADNARSQWNEATK